jgi:sialidase-1
MKKIYFFGVILLLFSGSLCRAQSDDVAWAVGGLRGRLLGPVSDTIGKNGEGSTIELKDGTILHAFSRHMRPTDIKRYPNPDLWPAVVAGMESHDGGVTWSTPRIMFRSSTGDNAMQPGFVRMSKGELGISYSLINSISSATKVFRFSTDEGRTWSPEIPISPAGSYWTSAHDRMLRLASGRILIPLHHKKVVRPEEMVTRVAYSDDNGRTWKLGAQEVTTSDIMPAFVQHFGARSAPGFWEASIAQLANGHLVMLGRTYGGSLYETLSSDDGLTWSPPKPTTLRSGAAPGRLARIPDSDDLLVVWNSCCVQPEDSLLGERITLSSAISSDGGQSWNLQRTMEAITPGDGNRVEYPAITFIDGKAFVSYRAASAAHIPNMDRMGMQEYLSILPTRWFYAAK